MEDENIICFQYLDGLDCCIELEERPSGFSGIANKEKYVAEYKNYDKATGKFFEYYDDVNKVFRTLDIPSKINYIDFSDSNYPYPEESINELDLTAKYMYGLCDLSVNCGYCKYLTSYKTYQENWNNTHLKTDIDTYCTVEDFKTGLLDYDIVFIEEHGGVVGIFNKSTIIGTYEKYDKASKKKYESDIKNLNKIKQENGTEYYWGIKPSFFEKYYGNNKLKNTIVWLGSCKGYMQDDLVNAFEKCGASAVIGYNNSVMTAYDNVLQNGFVYSLMHGDTVLDALEFSKNIWKSDDRTYCYSFTEFKVDKSKGESEPCGTEAKVNSNGKNTRLINLPYYGYISGKVTDENNKPVKGAEIGIHNVQGNSYGIIATTNENGEYSLECPQDSYKIGVKADGYEIFETEDFVSVNYNEETIFDIILESIETTEATTPPIATELQITAVDLIDKSIPEIISLMNGEYQIIKTESDWYIYIQNQYVFPGMEFYVQVSGDDIISANNGEEIHSDKLKAKLESGELILDGIQVNKSGKVTDSISVGMDYESCSKALGDFDCIGGNGGYLSGSIESVSYTYNEKNAEIILHFFDIPSKILSDLTSSKISSVSAEEMKFHNPKLKNVVIRKSEANTKPTNLTVNVDSTYIGEITKDNCTHYYTMNINEDNSLFTVQCTNSNGVKGGFDLPIDKLENGVYFYTNGSCYDRTQTGGRIHIVNGLTGMITVNNDGTLLWKTEDSLPYKLILTAE